MVYMGLPDKTIVLEVAHQLATFQLNYVASASITIFKLIFITVDHCGHPKMSQIITGCTIKTFK